MRGHENLVNNAEKLNPHHNWKKAQFIPHDYKTISWTSFVQMQFIINQILHIYKQSNGKHGKDSHKNEQTDWFEN